MSEISTCVSELFDVVAVDAAKHTVRLLESSKTEQNAEAIIRFAIIRRGLEEEFFAAVPSGKYKDGDAWCEH